MIYLDNAATTRLDDEVTEVMFRVMKNNYGNPSSVHKLGRESKVIIEEARNTIAEIIRAKPSEIYFTSSATEAISTAIYGAVRDLGIMHIITSPIEHHAVLHTLDAVRKVFPLQVSFVSLDKNAQLDTEHLEELLEGKPQTLVILMHANNETGTIYPVTKISKLCKNYNALFLTDTVQTIGKLDVNFSEIMPDFATCSAHKFHGPKGAGFLYVSERVSIKPFISGGGQERNLRSGTENIYGIAGMAKAFEVAYRDMEKNTEYISKLKSYFVEQLKSTFPELIFNANSGVSGLYNIVHVSVPAVYRNEMLLQNLDIKGIAVSGGSACSSGATKASHVLAAIHANIDIPSIRFSLSKFNTEQELEEVIAVMKKLML
jgi:cysteine desulfurase